MRDEIELRPKWLQHWVGSSSLIEPAIGSTSGVPDTFLIDHGFDPGWVEFKAIDDKGQFKLRPSQRSWAREYLRFSSRIAVVVMASNGFWTLPMPPLLLLPPGPVVPTGVPSPVRFCNWEVATPRIIKQHLEKCYA